MFDFVPFSPPGSPCSSSMDNNDIGAFGSVSPNANVSTHTHGLGTGVGLGQGQEPGPGQGAESTSSLQSFFFSDYSSLCDWAGSIGTAGPGIIDGTHHNHHTHQHFPHPNNAKVVLPPLSLAAYGCFGENESEADNPFPFLPTSSAAGVMDPWSNVQDLVARPLLDGLEDSLWPSGARIVATTAAPYA